MFRYSMILLTTMLDISTAASAQITFTIGGGNNNCGQRPYYNNNGYGVPPGHYYCNAHQSYCNHPANNGNRYGNRYGYGDDHRHRNNKRRFRNRGRNNWRNGNGNCPPGHYYCNAHRSYCSH
ncbi:MAG TPA: hypothetical protein EYO33_19390 [Phycisphaerales bacterium]|nr:hypothetical protein [Phycisphaerales bacterium]